ncbi:16S rRNA (guanine(527)-N(7))-methyltransferase RsmG [uncultured Pigmentiphaga sp.]|jgi:16S rRNA (guanine(527)-N(7))-methyltransferase GidB|uniref:16S rRNA (guanine(527)-N(7))-methyltransferase RsmG n=1 Tax=uncultured Pigmentiphaga sp. TaxID=340361 RepID=UPI00262525D8|nr:16S rRNA (guanine(527)-N(7))-methyltransferase RsmG [uncultured Pigmentiphaga sp.]
MNASQKPTRPQEPFNGAVFAAQLEADCATLRFPLDHRRIDLLLNYLAQMARWNATYNLTAIRDPEQMLLHHITDSLAVVPELAFRLCGQDARIMDVGSGGGLPGVVLAICRPEWQVCCVDAVEKKTAFVTHVAGMLGIPNLSARHARVEELQPAGNDIVISRAFASLQDFAALAGRHVKPGGRLVAMKGHPPEDEMQSVKEQGVWRVEAVTPLQVPRLSARRCLVWMNRIADDASPSGD